MQFFDPKSAHNEQLQQMLAVARVQDERITNTILSANQSSINQILVQLFLSSQFNSPQNKEIIESEPNPRRLAQQLAGVRFPTDINGNHVSLCESISNESWLSIFSFLAISDFYQDHNQSLHCVSKFFNKVIIDYFARVGELIGRKGYYTARDISTRIATAKTHEVECMFQFPNGLKQSVIVKKFPEISNSSSSSSLKNKQVEFEIVKPYHNNIDSVKMYCNDKEIKLLFDASDYRDREKTAKKSSASQPQLSNSNENKEIVKPKKLKFREMGDKLTLFQTNLIAPTPKNVILEKESLFGSVSGDYKLIDVNLQNMFNYYIYNSNHRRLKLFDVCDINRYSIAQMAYYGSKRRWVVGIIDNRQRNKELDYYLREFGRIQFIIDITDEFEGVFKDEFPVFENFYFGRRNVEQSYNLSRGKNGRYYCKCYGLMKELFSNDNDSDDNDSGGSYRIISPFGEKTTGKEQMKVLETEYEQEFRSTNYFLNLTNIKNNWDKMYSFWCKSDLINLNGRIPKLIVDYKYNNKWQCALILDKNEKESELYYYSSVDEMLKMMKNNNNIIKLQVYFSQQVGAVVYQRKEIVTFDLNNDFDAKRFTHFGIHTSEKQQLKMLRIACTWFENDNANDLWNEIQKL